ncbi:MAG: sulfite exporter TauE/SafE family protein [Hyphomicrobiaceae bacterium]
MTVAGDIALPGGLALAPQWLAFVVSGLIAAGIVKGATGLGYASAALPFLVATLGLKPGMALVLAPAMATNIAVALGAGQLRQTARMFWPLYLAMLPGIAGGLFLLTLVEAHRAVGVLAITIVAYAAYGLWRPDARLPHRLARMLKAPVGLASGLVTGLTGSQVMPLVPYVMAVPMAPAGIVQAINLGVLVASAALAVGLVLSATTPASLLALSLAAIPPALVGVEIGRRLRPLIPETRFRQLVLAVLMASGLAMLAR